MLAELPKCCMLLCRPIWDAKVLLSQIKLETISFHLATTLHLIKSHFFARKLVSACYVRNLVSGFFLFSLFTLPAETEDIITIIIIIKKPWKIPEVSEFSIWPHNKNWKLRNLGNAFLLQFLINVVLSEFCNEQVWCFPFWNEKLQNENCNEFLLFQKPQWLSHVSFTFYVKYFCASVWRFFWCLVAELLSFKLLLS